MAEHARLSCSNHRWPHCPGSIREEAVYPDTSGPAAIDGTGTHLLLERCIVDEVLPESLLGTTLGVGHEDKPEGWYIDKSRCDRVNVALEYIHNRVTSFLGYVDVQSESTVHPGEIYNRHDWWGTCDITLAADISFLEIIDYKDGYHYVSEKDNTQLISYALGRLYEMYPKKPETIRCTIIQPKNENNPIRYQDYTVDEIEKIGEELYQAAKATDDPNAPLFSGDWCKWCKHKSNCEAHVAETKEGFAMLMEKDTAIAQIDLASIPAMSNEELSRVLATREMLKIVTRVIERVEAEALTRIDHGAVIPHFVKGTGRGSKVWAEDEESIVKKLKGMRFKKDDLYPRKFLSPAQALKKENLTPRQKEKIEEVLVKYKPGKAKMVRQKVEVIPPEELFKDVIGEDVPIKQLNLDFL